MSDVIFVAASVVFFAIAVWYLNGCRALTKEEMLTGGNDHA